MIGGTFGSSFRAFHIVATGIAAMTRLSGLTAARCSGSCVKGTLWSNRRTLPIWTENEKQHPRRRILDPCHDRLQREFDQCSELDQAEQRLEHTAEHHHGKGNRKN